MVPVFNLIILFFGSVFLVISTISIGELFVKKNIAVSFFIGEALLSTVVILVNLLVPYPYNFILLFASLSIFVIKIAKNLKYKTFKPTAGNIISVLPMAVFVVVVSIFIPKLLLPNFAWDDVAYHFPAMQEISRGLVKFPLLTGSPYIDFQSFFAKFYGNLPFGFESYTSLLYLFSFGATSSAGVINIINIIFFMVFVTNLVKTKKSSNIIIGLIFLLLIFSCVDVLSIVATGYVDITVAIYQFISLAYLCKSLVKGDKNSVLLSTVFLSTTLSYKYTSFYILPLYLVFYLYGFVFKASFKNKLIEIAKTFIIGLFFGGFWYIKNLILYKNPIYPFALGHIGMSDFEYKVLLDQIYSPAKLNIIGSLELFLRQNPLAIYLIIIILLLCLLKRLTILSLGSLLLVFSLYLYLVDFALGSQISRFVLILPFTLAFVALDFFKNIDKRLGLIIVLVLVLNFRFSQQLWSIVSAQLNDDKDFLRGRFALIQERNVGCSSDVVRVLDSLESSNFSTLNLWDPFASIYFEGANKFVNFGGQINNGKLFMPSGVDNVYVNEILKDSFVNNPYFHRDINVPARVQFESKLLQKSRLVYNSGACSLYKLN